jgi:predicted phosphoadenosine phosphosulfate sulfurtransferase
MGVGKRVAKYVSKWSRQGYPEDIPDEVPEVLEHEGLAPSYRAITLALLNNDTQLLSLGFQPRHNEWYNAIKRMEIENR